MEQKANEGQIHCLFLSWKISLFLPLLTSEAISSHLTAHPFPYLPTPSLPLVHSTSLASLLFLQHSRLAPALEHLFQLFSLLKTLCNIATSPISLGHFICFFFFLSKALITF